ncbi:NCS2 family permease [Spiribacter halobius]|uniref:Permease n=1 Tax=Sediminicurvatus halobius TaxID=2182432 RepID=A0A2U2MX19_9GAMM|nr:NCS2 family permease [Spiribacter halobius]PWG61346.1 permease [Spiribacter halobius]UEX76740.1 NCS2 family permease [Spiribacter halobius]
MQRSVSDAAGAASARSGVGAALERYFDIPANGSTLRTELLAGLATFLAAMYIIVVNPAILSDAGIPFPAALTATVIISFIASLGMGLYARNPILVAPGMGMNALFSYTLVQGAGIEWQTALGCVFWAGVLFSMLAVFNVRQWIVDAIPAQLRYGITCGIGLFITLIGFKNAQFIVQSPATLVTAAPVDAAVLTFLAGLGITAVLVARRVTGALILGIIATTILAIPIGRLWGDGSRFAPPGSDATTLVNWQGLFAAPDFSAVLQVDILGALSVAYWPFIFVFLFTNFFDALSTFLGLSEAAGLKDEKGNPRNLRQAMTVDAGTTMLASLLGTSPTNSYIESGAGIAQGGRTGLVAVLAAMLFLPFLFLSPLLSLVPTIATAPVLVLVGLFMMAPVQRIDWADYTIAVPAFLAMILMPLTYSITHGIAYGFVAFVVVKVLAGRGSEVRLAMWIVAALSALMLFSGH